MFDAIALRDRIADLDEKIESFRRQAEQQLAVLQGKRMALQELLDELEGSHEDASSDDGGGVDLPE